MDNRPTNEITDYPLELQELKVMIKRAEQRQWKIRWDLNKREEMGTFLKASNRLDTL